MAERVKQWLLHTLTLHEMWELLRNPRDTIRTDVIHGRLCVCLYVEVLQLLATASLLAVSPMAKKRKRLLQTATLTDIDRERGMNIQVQSWSRSLQSNGGISLLKMSITGISTSPRLLYPLPSQVDGRLPALILHAGFPPDTSLHRC